MKKALKTAFVRALVVVGVSAMAATGALARDRGFNQPSAAGGTAGVSEPGAGGRDPGFNQSGIAGDLGGVVRHTVRRF